MTQPPSAAARPLGLRRALSLLAAALLLAACASGGGPGRAAGFETIRGLMSLAGAHFDDPHQLDHEVLLVDTVAAPPAGAWRGVLRAYSALRIPVTRFDENLLWIGGSSQPMGLIGGSKPSAWLDCGHGMAEQYADAYQVTFSIATRVMPLGSGSTVESLLVASARPRDVMQASFKCTTRGTLEDRIADIVRGQPTTSAK